jgi:putative transposase
MCRLSGVSRATFYRRLRVRPNEERECELRNEIEEIALRWEYYGSRRIQKELNRRGRQVGRELVQRILRENGLLCLRRPTGWLTTTDSKHGLPVFPNLVGEWRPTAINQLWVTDITYIRLRTSFVFLAAMLDAFSRRVIGWAIDRHFRAELCIEALEMALAARHYPKGVIHHSDRGVQYCSNEYTALLAKYAMRGSMARKGNPYDNAIAESFWKTLKYEQVYRNEYRTIEEARANVGTFINSIYNHRRLHSALGYVPPVEYEAAARQLR